MDFTYSEIAKTIDHSLLNPTLTDSQLEAGCRLACLYDVASVCIKPYYVSRCSELLAGTNVQPGTVIGFPHGSPTTAMKVKEAEVALLDGARELDLVVNIGKVLSEDWVYIRSEVQAVVDVAHQGNAIVKAILENCYLDSYHKVELCGICAETGVDFVKTSTGYGNSGATLEDLKLMRRHSSLHVRVEAAGGVRTLDALLELRALGVTRFGMTRTAEVLQECRHRLGLLPVMVVSEQAAVEEASA